MRCFFFQIFALCASFGLAAVCSARSGELRPIEYNNPGLVVDLGVGLWTWPLPMDYDGDGDLDLLVSCTDKPWNGMWFFENPGGGAKMPVFKPGVRVGPGIKNIRSSIVDGNARLTALRQEYEKFLEKGFDAPVDLPVSMGKHKVLYGFGQKIRADQWSYADVNADGAADLIVGQGDWADYGWDNAYDEKGQWKNGPLRGFVYVALNSGTNARPEYRKPFKVKAGAGPAETYGMPSPNFADFDGDGDMDLIAGEFLDRLTWFENVGTAVKPEFAPGRFLTHDGEIIRMDLEMIVPTAIDWDGDGDPDLIVGQEDGRVAFLENAGRSADGMPDFLPPAFFKQEADYVKFGALATPVGVDWDADGDEDLLAGDTAGYIGFIENLGGGASPRWAGPVYLKADGKVLRIQAGENGSIQGPAEAKWGYTTLSAADWNGDGLKDLLVNSILGEVFWLENVGSKTAPELAEPQPIEVDWPGEPPYPIWNWKKPQGRQLITQWRTTPFAVDFNRDGLMDLLMLDHEGYLALFERRSEDGELHLMPGRRIFADETGAPLRLNEKEAGHSGRRKICAVDWDGDGDLDLLANNKNVELRLNEGEGAGGKFVYRNMGSMSDVVLAGHSTSPTVVDWDNNDVPDLLLGAEDGHFYWMENPNGGDYQ